MLKIKFVILVVLISCQPRSLKNDENFEYSNLELKQKDNLSKPIIYEEKSNKGYNLDKYADSLIICEDDSLILKSKYVSEKRGWEIDLFQENKLRDSIFFPPHGYGRPNFEKTNNGFQFISKSSSNAMSFFINFNFDCSKGKLFYTNFDLKKYEGIEREDSLIITSRKISSPIEFSNFQFEKEFIKLVREYSDSRPDIP